MTKTRRYCFSVNLTPELNDKLIRYCEDNKLQKTDVLRQALAEHFRFVEGGGQVMIKRTYRPRACAFCGDKFIPTSGNQKHCGKHKTPESRMNKAERKVLTPAEWSPRIEKDELTAPRVLPPIKLQSIPIGTRFTKELELIVKQGGK